MKAHDGLKKTRSRGSHSERAKANHHTQSKSRAGHHVDSEHPTKSAHGKTVTSSRGHRAHSARIRLRKRNSPTTHSHREVTAA